MDTNMTFRMDSEVKREMASICKELGMSTSTAFNLFANAFVRTKGMPFQITMQPSTTGKTLSTDAMLADTDNILQSFAEDYKRMAE